MVLYLISNHWD